jgi:hypothetical protein
MAKLMKTTAAPMKASLSLTVRVDPLRVARGLVVMRRGGLHATPRRAGRAAGKRAWMRDE